MSAPQTDEKAQIKMWLKATGRTREWLGENVHVKKRTVNNWLSSAQQIPADKLTLIQRLMADEDELRDQERRKAFSANQVFSLEVDLPTYRAYSEAAKKARQTLEEWSITELNEAARGFFGGTEAQEQSSVSPPDKTDGSGSGSNLTAKKPAA
jgi:hypothetical protein